MYPLNWKAEGKPCLVVGAGHVAVRKVRGLLAAGAQVTVEAPQAAEDILRLVDAGQLQHRGKVFEPGDEQGFHLVISTTGIRAVADYLSEAAEAQHFLYNAADFPSLGNCAIPAHFERGDLVVAISTEGKSPAFARYVKNWLEEAIPDHFGDWLDRLAALRGEARERLRTSAERERFWRAAFSSEVTSLAAAGHLEEAEEYIRNAMGGFGPES